MTALIKQPFFQAVLEVNRRARKESRGDCREDMQRRLMILSGANEASSGERVAKDLLLRRCRSCGECWMARL